MGADIGLKRFLVVRRTPKGIARLLAAQLDLQAMGVTDHSEAAIALVEAL